jgi:hypothetical protein
MTMSASPVSRGRACDLVARTGVGVGVDDEVGAALEGRVVRRRGRRVRFVATKANDVTTPRLHVGRAIRDPSSTTRTSMTSMPGRDLGSSASVAGSVSASLRHGIWMMSFVNDWPGCFVPETS